MCHCNYMNGRWILLLGAAINTLTPVPGMWQAFLFMRNTAGSPSCTDFKAGGVMTKRHALLWKVRSRPWKVQMAGCCRMTMFWDWLRIRHLWKYFKLQV